MSQQAWIVIQTVGTALGATVGVLLGVYLGSRPPRVRRQRRDDHAGDPS